MSLIGEGGSRALTGFRARVQAVVPQSREARIALVGLGILLLVGGLLRILFMIAWRPAFIGYPDAGSYIGAAQRGLFEDAMRPAGYPLFLRLVHDVVPNLSVTILLQHLLGMASAVFLYLAVGRAAVPRWLGLIPAAIVLLGGAGVFLEHAPLTEALYVFLISAALYAAVRSIDNPNLSWPVLLAALIAVAATVRVVALLLLPVLLVWLLLASGGSLRPRLLRFGVALAAGTAIVAGYIEAQRRDTGYTGITRAGMWNLYGLAATFADCSKFTPPNGTKVLCEKKPTSERPSAEQYIFDATVSPAVQRFKAPFFSTPEDNEKVAAFARAAILGQTFDYLAYVAKGMAGYIAPEAPGLRLGSNYEHFFHRVLFDPAIIEQVKHGALPYYGPGPAKGVYVRPGLLDVLKKYESVTRLQGPVMALLLLLSVAGPFLTHGRTRSATILFAVVTWMSLVSPVATHWWDARLSVPAFGPLGASAALGGWALAPVVRRRWPSQTKLLSFLESIARGLRTIGLGRAVSVVRRFLEARFGRLWQSATTIDDLRFKGSTIGHLAHLRAWGEGGEEATMARLLKQAARPGDVVVDVGAYLGYFTMLAAREVGPQGRVIAFEPNPVSRELLCANVHENAFEDRVTVMSEALSDAAGFRTFYCDSSDGSTSGLVRPRERLDAEVEVECAVADELLGGIKPSMVKIDVEGGEVAALRGMHRLLEAAGNDLVVFAECNREALERSGTGPDALLSLLGETGLHVWAIDEAQGKAVPLRTAQGIEHANLVCMRDPTRLGLEPPA